MFSTHDIISGLTSANSEITADKQVMINKFSQELGWNPSYFIEPAKEKRFVSSHLVVEHGLETSAIISFLTSSYYDLSIEERKELLNISYNNLVDWHIHIEKDTITYVNNRLNYPERVIESHKFGREQYENLRSEAFEKIIGIRKSPNIPALDTVLIDTILYWKVHLSSELENQIDNTQLSSLFNSIFFIRALEDNIKRFHPDKIKENVLLSVWRKFFNRGGEYRFREIIENALILLNYKEIPSYLIDYESLDIFSSLNIEVWKYVFNDFYDLRNSSNYKYDFSIMSHHALSRIYEKYIAILKVEDKAQYGLFPDLPKVSRRNDLGSVFTPQYIARFFAKYLKEYLPPYEFKRIKVAEPAVGSGIFLRTFLEIKCDPRQDGITKDVIKDSFQDILGIDIDPNAVKATQLSLSLLQLILTDEFPSSLSIKNENTITFLNDNKDLYNSFDAVISNPPFISVEKQSQPIKEIINQFMSGYATGRIDAYLAFLKLGLDLLKEGGYGMFVIPHSFLISKNSTKMRKYIYENFSIRCIADLSAVPVFPNTGIYVILLIVQKNGQLQIGSSNTTIIKCIDFPGKALEAGLKKEFQETESYNVYEVNQSIFKNNEWYILPKHEIELQHKLEKFLPLSDFLHIRQGFVSGNDNVFILLSDKIKTLELEMDLFVPFLPDKEMEKYTITNEENKYFFFPFKNGKKLSISELEKNYPKTWDYFQEHKSLLIDRASKDESNWIYPHRPRPDYLMEKKIITPHLVFTQKFSLDLEGKFAVSRTPFMYIKTNTNVKKSKDLLKYFAAVLNSSICFWYISSHSHKYNNGYSMLEVKSLSQTPIPDPKYVPAGKMRKIISLVNDRLNRSGYEAIKIEREIDNIVAELYQLTQQEKELIGIEDIYLT